MLSAREALAAFVGAAPEELVYVPNASTGRTARLFDATFLGSYSA